MTMNTKPTRTPARQPLHAAEIADALLKLQTVVALTGLGKTSIYARIKAGEFKPVRLGARCTRFKASDVQAWLQAQGK
jgi:excisionase family DNA binding protein